MAANGQLPASALASIPGGQLAKAAAGPWNAMVAEVFRRAGVTLLPSGPRASYRTLAQQWELWRLYQSGRGNLAAYPGTSNHGWGLAVDLATTAMRALLDRYGYPFGWSKRLSDAPSEWWHIRYTSGIFHGPAPAPVDPLTSRERRLVNELHALRARNRSGWKRPDLDRAKAIKRWILGQIDRITKAAKQSGWNTAHRQARVRILRTAYAR